MGGGRKKEGMKKDEIAHSILYLHKNLVKFHFTPWPMYPNKPVSANLEHRKENNGWVLFDTAQSIFAIRGNVTLNIVTHDNKTNSYYPLLLANSMIAVLSPAS